MDGSVYQIFRVKAFGQQAKIMNTLSDVSPHLVGVYHTRKGD
jgi:hypothetical protein